ncbi:MAG: cytochrome b N-terminal domain-containing protein [Dissulfurispiraceae bacterium]
MFTKIWSWFNERWPISSLLRWSLDEEIPGGSRFPYTLGSAIITVFLLQAVTGMLQLFFYVQTVDHAYDSLSFLRTRVPFGWLINGLHYWGANAMIILVSLHIARVFVWGAYKNPRQLTWLFGIGLLLITMGLSFTGGPLPWDQNGYWAAEVGTSIPGSIPIVGDTIKQIMRGGEDMGQLTLSRFFTIHTSILPPTLLALITLHLIAFRRFGSVGPWHEAERGVKGIFWPDQVYKDLVVGVIVILALITLSVFAAKPFSGPADPLDTSYIPKPDWNFLFLYEALKFFPGKLEPIGSVGVPTVLIFILVALPFIDRNPDRNPVKRPVAMASGLLLAAILIVLTVVGYYSKPAATEPSTTSAPMPSKGSVPSPIQRGAQLFQSLGCNTCHRINAVGGSVGPDLSREGVQGRTRDWLAAQIRTPKAHNPSSVMPPFSSLSERQVDDVVEYLLSLGAKDAKSPSQPPGIVQQPLRAAPEPAAPSDRTGMQTPRQPEAMSSLKEQRGPASYMIGSAERGGILYDMECKSCHGPQGRGSVTNPGSEDGKVPPLNPIDRELFSRDPESFAENIDTFLQHGSIPKGSNPQLHMPTFGDTNSLTQQQIANIEAYVMRLNGVDRAQIVNPGLTPWNFFMIVVPSIIILLLITGGIYRCLPRSGPTEGKRCPK